MVRHLSEKSMTLYDFTFFLCVFLTYLEDTMQKARVECGVIYECECGGPSCRTHDIIVQSIIKTHDAKARCPLRATFIGKNMPATQYM